MPSWLKIACIVLFAVTCVFVIRASVRYMSQPQLQSDGQMQMYDNTNDVDSVAVDSLELDSVL